MPLYEFQNIETEEVKEFYFSIKNPPQIGSIVEIENEKWKRLFPTNVQGIVKGSSTPISAQQFAHDTARKKGTVGDLFDQAQEQSEKRAKQSVTGRDSVQDKWFDNWSKKRSGKKHPADTRPKKQKN
jgi:hypothetical protein